MDTENNSGNINEQGYLPVAESLPPAPRKRSGWRIFWGIFITLSILANILLFLMIIGLSVFFAAGQQDVFTEQEIQAGPRTQKIVVIGLRGLINDRNTDGVLKQLKAAREDTSVKGVIIRVNSPGGKVSSSDQIYNEIRMYRERTGKPVVAFMQGIAASGGYYASVACDKIVAEPTVITGSVGVIMNYFVFQELLEEKLGVLPVVVKSGQRKDWPSPFKPLTEEQRKYLEDKVISPAYERFVQLVDQGRESLSLVDVKRLADGSIYPAQEALEQGLIDKISYLDGAIEEVKSLAGIKQALVVEYHKPFSMSALFGAESRKTFGFDRATLSEWSTPELMYLWKPY